MKTKVSRAFAAQFGGEGILYGAPGRINLIGEHTDYNDGYVMPGAIDLGIVASIRPNGEGVVRAYAMDLEQGGEFTVGDSTLPSQSWLRYIYGVCQEVQKRGGKVEGFDALFAGDLPLGSGLSSSAALESVFGFAISDMFNGGEIDRFELARIGQSTEHNYCGVKCGIMDQFASLHGRKGHLMRLDCRSMEYEYFPFESEEYRLVLINSNVKHELSGSPYNRRRESCERVAKELGMTSLRGATMDQLLAIADRVSDEDMHRAKYVIGEEQRVLGVCDALVKGDFERVGELMYATHMGLSKDYEVSCEELDFLNDIAKECGVTGSRMMGGGFGGCTINLVRGDKYNEFIATTLSKFKEKYGIDAGVIDVVISDGARKLEE
ncbi:MAG: galactokinase [Rikenellaceae bacterium]